MRGPVDMTLTKAVRNEFVGVLLNHKKFYHVSSLQYGDDYRTSSHRAGLFNILGDDRILK